MGGVGADELLQHHCGRPAPELVDVPSAVDREELEDFFVDHCVEHVGCDLDVGVQVP